MYRMRTHLSFLFQCIFTVPHKLVHPELYPTTVNVCTYASILLKLMLLYDYRHHCHGFALFSLLRRVFIFLNSLFFFFFF